MAQMKFISRPLQQLNPFVAGQVQPVQNPISRGFDNAFRIDHVTFEILLQVAIATTPGTVTLLNRAELDSILNAACVNIRLFSSTYGDLIRSLTLAQLNKAVEYLSGEHAILFGMNGIGTPSVTGGTAPAGSLDIQIKVRVPFNLIKHAARAAHAPRVMGFQDGGLSYTTGTGLCTIGGLVGTVNAASSNINIYLEGPTNAPIVKTSPLLYEQTTFNALQGNEHSAGLYYLLMQDTDSAFAAFGGVGGNASGWRMFIDGEAYAEMNDTDPLNAVEDVMRGLGGAEAWRVAAGFDGTVANSESTFNVPGIPLIRTPYTARSWDLAVASQRIVTDMGTAYTAASNFLSVRVIPTNQVPDVKQCPCNGGASATPTGMPGEGSATSSAVAPYAPQRAN